METKFLENIGEFTAYTVIIVAAFIKVISSVYNSIKIFLDKKKKNDNSNVTVNVTNPNANFCNLPSKDSYSQLLYYLLEQGKILKAMHDMKSDILKEQMERVLL